MMKSFEENEIFQGNFNMDELILDTIKDVLITVLGRKSYSIIDRMMRDNSINWKDVPYNAEFFSKLLMIIFGHSHVIIEDLIVESIYEKIGVNFTAKKNYFFHI